MPFSTEFANAPDLWTSKRLLLVNLVPVRRQSLAALGRVVAVPTGDSMQMSLTMVGRQARPLLVDAITVWFRADETPVGGRRD